MLKDNLRQIIYFKKGLYFIICFIRPTTQSYFATINLFLVLFWPAAEMNGSYASMSVCRVCGGPLRSSALSKQLTETIL